VSNKISVNLIFSSSANCVPITIGLETQFVNRNRNITNSNDQNVILLMSIFKTLQRIKIYFHIKLHWLILVMIGLVRKFVLSFLL